MIRTTLADFTDFLRRPRLLAYQGFSVRTLVPMAGLYLAGLALIGALLAMWQRMMHLPAPEAFGKFPPMLLVPIVVIAAPIAEECVFRGWLTGRPRALWLLGCALVAGALLVGVSLKWHDQICAIGVLGVAVAAAAGWFVLRRRTDPPVWFARGFGMWFALSVLGFALAHLSNYPRISPALVPMVLPQLWAGLVFAHVRLRHGLAGSMLVHAIGNATALAIALLVH